MSLQFYLGRTGTGKTARIIEEMKAELVAQPLGEPIIYLVPDQMSLQAETKLLGDEALRGSMRAQVFSFTRLAWLVLGETGGMARTHLNQEGIHLFLRKIIDEQANQLRMFGKASDKMGFIDQMAALLTEYKRYCIEPEQLKAAAETATSPTLQAKLADLSLLYEQFATAFSKQYLDSDDYFKLLIEKIPQSKKLKEATVYIDGFNGFTPLEKLMIEQLLLHCRKLVVALTLDKPYHQEKPLTHDLFRMTGETYYELKQLVISHQIEQLPDVVLTETIRYADSSALAHLEEHFNNRPLPKYASEQSAIEVIAATNRRNEVEQVARQIVDLVRTGYRYRDILVLNRNGNQYRDLVETIFSDYQIPTFVDQKQKMLHHPLIELVTAVLEAVDTNFAYDAMFRAFKTGLFVVDAEAVAMLENYVLARGIRGQKWDETWRFRFNRGLEFGQGVQSDEERAIEKQLNQLRIQLFTPIRTFAQQIKAAKMVQEQVMALFTLLDTLQVANKLEEWAIVEEKAGYLLKARTHKQAWTSLTGLMDQFIEICGDEKLSLNRFRDVLTSGLRALKFSLVPPSLDQVIVGNLDLSKPLAVKVLFVLGLNEGVLPKRISDDGILSEADRMKLLEQGIYLAPSNETVLFDETFVAYMTFALPTERLFLSYPIADEEGKSLLASPFIKRIKDLFPTVKERTNEDEWQFITQSTQTLAYLLEKLLAARSGEVIATVWWDVYNEYMQDEEKKDTATFVLSSLFHKNTAEKLSEETVTELYGETLSGSVSRIEWFNRCPFSYFSRYGLRLQERAIFKFETPDLGTFFHESIRHVAEELERQELSWADIDERGIAHLADTAAEAIAPFLQNEILTSSERMRFLKKKYTAIIRKTVDALRRHAIQSEFRPVAFELPFGTPDSKIPALSIALKKGKQLMLNGRIDRIDMANDSMKNEAYLSVIDFKSGKKDIDYTEVYYGIALQMFTYLNVVLTHSNQLVTEPALPAGMLYFHIHNPILRDEESFLTGSDRERAILQKFKMTGLLAENTAILTKMDKEIPLTAKSDMVPISLKKDGTFSKSSRVADLDELDLLRKHTELIYQRSGNAILDGVTAISPYKRKGKNSCTYCAYRTVCQFDHSLPSNRFRLLQDMKKEEVIERIQQEVGRDE